MRAVAFAVLLIGCASAPSLRDGASIDVLTPRQLEQAYDGRTACVVHPDDGACETLAFLVSATSQRRTMRLVGATDLEALTREPMTEVVRGLAMFASYQDLFRHLEEQRASGGFRHVKTVSTEETALDRSTNRWCSRAPITFDDTAFYFSNSLSADVTHDERLTEENEAGLRAFLRAVIKDEQFRTIGLERAQENGAAEEMRRMFSMLDGASENCASFAGVVARGVIELTAMNVAYGDVHEQNASRAIRTYPLSATPPLRAN
jgi:hypothetical protein